MNSLSPRAVLSLQRRLYDLWATRLMAAVEISEQAGPSDRLDEVLAHVEGAAAGIRAAMEAERQIESGRLD